MAKVSIDSQKLRVSLSAIERLAALQGSFEISLGEVRGATGDPDYLRAGIGIRSPGTGLPGLVATGTFRKNGDRVLSLWRRGQQVVVIELANAKWDRLLLGCEDAKALAKLVNKALGH